MKMLYTKKYLLVAALFCGFHAYSQTTNPISQQRRKALAPGEKLNDLPTKFNPTLLTKANATLGSGIVDGADVRIFASSNVQAEAIVAINKTNTMNLLASANTLVGPGNYNQGFYYSFDGGLTWNGADKLQKIAQGDSYGDPAIAFSAAGTAFMTTISANGGYWFQKSTNGGATWGKGKQVTGSFSFDKEMITSDNEATSPFANNYYAAWTDFGSGNGAVVFNKSTDNGATFSPEITLRSGAVGFGQGTNVQTGPNGEVYVCWADHKTLTSPYKADHMGFASSADGGVTFTPAKKIFPYTGIRVSGGNPLFNGVRINDFPAMAVDKSSGVNKGRIYIVYAAQYNDTGKAVVLVSSSSDGGTSWGAPVTVSTKKGKQNFLPWIAVDDTNGDVWVDYYSFDSAKGTFTTNTYVARSVDGGATWKNQKVSDVSHITAAIDNSNFATGYAGDYIGITAYGGKAYPVWMDNRNGTWQIYCSPVSASSFASAAKTSSLISANNNNMLSAGPNPFNDVINVALTGETPSSVLLYNESGTLVKQWSNLKSTTLNVNDVPKGIYVIKVISAKGKASSQKLIKQ